ncbi:hypothetical protein GIB67_000619, partial [Kingdonia uniflora]
LRARPSLPLGYNINPYPPIGPSVRAQAGLRSGPTLMISIKIKLNTKNRHHHIKIIEYYSISFDKNTNQFIIYNEKHERGIYALLIYSVAGLSVGGFNEG